MTIDTNIKYNDNNFIKYGTIRDIYFSRNLNCNVYKIEMLSTINKNIINQITYDKIKKYKYKKESEIEGLFNETVQWNKLEIIQNNKRYKATLNHDNSTFVSLGDTEVEAFDKMYDKFNY